jgi:hypothetical protein
MLPDPDLTSRSEASTVSFVVRFVYEAAAGAPDAPAVGWYSVIRHVQSNTERRLTRWADVVAFMEQYVNLEQSAAHE